MRWRECANLLGRQRRHLVGAQYRNLVGAQSENGGSAETWLRMQIDYDLWQINQSRPLPKVKQVVLEAA